MDARASTRVEEFLIIHARWLDKHHFEPSWVKELLESIGLVQVGQDLDVVVHDVVVLHAAFPLFLLALAILSDHTEELLLSHVALGERILFVATLSFRIHLERRSSGPWLVFFFDGLGRFMLLDRSVVRIANRRDFDEWHFRVSLVQILKIARFIIVVLGLFSGWV